MVAIAIGGRVSFPKSQSTPGLRLSVEFCASGGIAVADNEVLGNEAVNNTLNIVSGIEFYGTSRGEMIC